MGEDKFKPLETLKWGEMFNFLDVSGGRESNCLVKVGKDKNLAAGDTSNPYV